MVGTAYDSFLVWKRRAIAFAHPTRASAACGSSAACSSPPAEQPQYGLGRALARLPGTADCTPQRLVHGLAGEEHAVERLRQNAARWLSARRRRREGAKHIGLLVPARGVPALHL